MVPQWHSVSGIKGPSHRGPSGAAEWAYSPSFPCHFPWLFSGNLNSDCHPRRGFPPPGRDFKLEVRPQLIGGLPGREWAGANARAAGPAAAVCGSVY